MNFPIDAFNNYVKINVDHICKNRNQDSAQYANQVDTAWSTNQDAILGSWANHELSALAHDAITLKRALMVARVAAYDVAYQITRGI
jgi:hypothetical protein